MLVPFSISKPIMSKFHENQSVICSANKLSPAAVKLGILLGKSVPLVMLAKAYGWKGDAKALREFAEKFKEDKDFYLTTDINLHELNAAVWMGDSYFSNKFLVHFRVSLSNSHFFNQ